MFVTIVNTSFNLCHYCLSSHIFYKKLINLINQIIDTKIDAHKVDSLCRFKFDNARLKVHQ